MNIGLTLGFINSTSGYTVNEDEGALSISIAVDLQDEISEDAVAQVQFATTAGNATVDGK